MKLEITALGLLGLVLAELTIATNIAVRNECSHNNCLRAFIRKGFEAAAFCSTFKAGPISSPFPSFASACTGDKTSRISSACSCLKTAISTTSSISSSAKSSTSASTSSSTSTTSTPAPSCEPSFSLVGASEHDFNKKSAPFSLELSCTPLDIANVSVFANYVSSTAFTATADGISFSGFTDDYVLLAVFALDTYGTPIIATFQLLFGTNDMPVLVLGADGNPVSNALITANATIYPGVGHVCTTDTTGKCIFHNLPATTIGLVAKTADNSIAVDGLAASTGLVTLKLLAYVPPSATASFDVANGTTGWTGGVQSTLKVKRDATLVVSTNGKYDLQTANNSFPVHPFTKSAYIKYKFVTQEVPGGYFGTQYNDYYNIIIRSDTGAFVTVTNSMNALGLGAFDASGATDWFTLVLPVPSNTKSVQYIVGVSNVADNLLDSEIIVDKVGDLQCDNCGDCSTCPSDPMCQPSCQNPPLKTCDFYRNCAEGQLGCGGDRYPIAYGEKNCIKISKNVNFFSPAGQNWVWNTMHCLQEAMVPVLTPCTATCDSFTAAAFASHTACYLDNGICALPCTDLLFLFISVGTDLFTEESLKQAWGVGVGCMENVVQTLQGCGGEVAFGILIKYILSAKP